MARRGRGTRGRASSASGRAWLWRALAALVLVGLVAAGWGWWAMRHWTPPRSSYQVQGVEVSVADGDVDFTAIKAIGADFAYVDASASAFARDPAVAKNLEEARAAGLQVGAVHAYDPCQPAERQAANFVTVVPRDTRLLPPAVELVRLTDDCPEHVSDAAVVSELMTFINQIETHSGKAVILKIGPDFETRYHIARALDRNLWLMRDRIEPDYAGRPFTMWTANSALANNADERPLRWVVVQP